MCIDISETLPILHGITVQNKHQSMKPEGQTGQVAKGKAWCGTPHRQGPAEETQPVPLSQGDSVKGLWVKGELQQHTRQLIAFPDPSEQQWAFVCSSFRRVHAKRERPLGPQVHLCNVRMVVPIQACQPERTSSYYGPILVQT